MKVAILGAQGFLGSELYNCFRNRYNVYGITKSNYTRNCGEEFDIFVNANGNSKRFWANNNILEDFEASTLSVYRTFFDFKIKYYIYISSIDVYEGSGDISKTKEKIVINPKNLNSYGFHKYLSELIVKKYSKKYLILRCSAMVGKNLKKGVIKDIVDGQPLFVTLDSKLQFISTSEIARIVMKIVNDDIHNEIFNVGGAGAVSLNCLGTIFQKNLATRNNAEKQVYEMDVTKLSGIFSIKKSEEYLKEYFT